MEDKILRNDKGNNDLLKLRVCKLLSINEVILYRFEKRETI
jgi:hypothetical protein